MCLSGIISSKKKKKKKCTKVANPGTAACDTGRANRHECARLDTANTDDPMNCTHFSYSHPAVESGAPVVAIGKPDVKPVADAGRIGF